MIIRNIKNIKIKKNTNYTKIKANYINKMTKNNLKTTNNTITTNKLNNK